METSYTIDDHFTLSANDWEKLLSIHDGLQSLTLWSTPEVASIGLLGCGWIQLTTCESAFNNITISHVWRSHINTWPQSLPDRMKLLPQNVASLIKVL